MNRINLLKNPAVRLWLYGIAMAGFGVMGVYGLLSSEQIAAWGLLASALFAVAAANTPRTPGRHAAETPPMVG